MSYEVLLSEGRIKRHAPDRKGIKNLLSVAQRDSAIAAQTLAIDPDWAFTIAYNSVLQASRALMMSQGFRPRGPDQHVTVARFLRAAQQEGLGDHGRTFDRMRRKRHQAV